MKVQISNFKFQMPVLAVLVLGLAACTGGSGNGEYVAVALVGANFDFNTRRLGKWTIKQVC